MALALVLVGILTGLISAIVSLVAGSGILVALLAYPLGGMLGMIGAAGFIALRHALPSAPLVLKPGPATDPERAA